jgi:hypothetical protein
MMRLALAAATGVAITLASNAAIAAAPYFNVNVTILRPAIMKKGNASLRERDPDHNATDVSWEPASYQLVEVYQDNAFGPQFCGSAYTNSLGHLDATFVCGGNLPNQIELAVRGESLRGFRVGYNSPLPWEALTIAYAWNWWLGWKPVNQKTTVPYGTWYLGGDYLYYKNANDLNFRVAALVDLLDEMYEELNLFGYGLIADPSRTPTYVYSKWLINDATAQAIGSPVPWTYWDTVHINQNISTFDVLGAAPHELGHVIYNTRHSDINHYLTEVAAYAKSHDVCTGYGTPYDSRGSQFANYEGFAHSVKSLFFRHHAEGQGFGDYTDTLPSCPTSSVNFEGNVAEFYTALFGGQPLARPDASLANWTTHRIGANLYAFPPTTGLFSLPSTARFMENTQTVWSAALKSMCSSTNLGAPAYCGSRRFKCLVKNQVMAAGENLGTEFSTVNCDPGRSIVVALTKQSNTSVKVDLSPADLADSYSILVKDGATTTTTPVNVDALDVTKTMSKVVTTPDCSKKSLSVFVQTSVGSGAGAKTMLGTGKSFVMCK